MTTSAAATRERLMTAALDVVRTKGLAAASARAIATEAGANQALIFYHFNTVTELIEAASNEAVQARVREYAASFAAVESLPQLVALARTVHDRERGDGNIAVMAQLMAGGQHDPVLARATRHAISVWTNEIERVLDRVLATTPVGSVLDSAGLAHIVSATFIGIELYQGTDAEGAERALATLEQLDTLVSAINDLGPVAQTALRVATRRAGSRAAKRSAKSPEAVPSQGQGKRN